MEYLPDYLVGLIVIESFVRFHPSGDNHWQHDIATLLARCVTHHATNGLNHINLGVTRSEEQYGVQCWHIHALRQAAHVAEDATGIGRRLSLQPPQLGFLLAGIHTAINVLGLAGQPRSLVDFLGFLISLHDRLEHVGNVDGTDLVLRALVIGRNNLAKRYSTLHRFIIPD
ncbi:hypothetical protein D3C76_661470 [compost metagenome]